MNHVTPEFQTRVAKLPTLNVNGIDLVPANRTSTVLRQKGVLLLINPLKWAIPGGGMFTESELRSMGMRIEP